MFIMLKPLDKLLFMHGVRTRSVYAWTHILLSLHMMFLGFSGLENHDYLFSCYLAIAINFSQCKLRRYFPTTISTIYCRCMVTVSVIAEQKEKEK